MAIGVNRADVEGMLAAIRLLHDETGRLGDDHDGQAASGSPAAEELAELGEPMTDAYIQGHTLLEVAADQMTAFTRTLVEPIQTIAPWTCVRSLLEACAVAAWLLDPGTDARTRLGRSYAYRYEGLSQQVKCCRSSGTMAAEVAAIEGQLDAAEAEAIALGFGNLADKNGRRIGIGQRMPGATELIGRMLGEGFAYRLLSGIAHGHFWATQQFGFRPAGAAPEPSREAKSLEKHLAFEHAAFLCMKAARSFSLPVWFEHRLLGWDDSRLIPLFERVADAVRLAEEGRFWRGGS
jgi:hypothetical protein